MVGLATAIFVGIFAWGDELLGWSSHYNNEVQLGLFISFILGIVPVVARTVEEMMLRGLMHRVIGRPDPRHRGDIGEFADAGVGDIGQPRAIGVIAEVAIGDMRALAHLAIGAEGGIDDLAIGVKMRGGGGKSGHRRPVVWRERGEGRGKRKAGRVVA